MIYEYNIREPRTWYVMNTNEKNVLVNKYQYAILNA